jgi:hypothetical protein
MPKRENPHTTKPEDTGDYTHRVDPATGELLDCIPVHKHRVQKLMPSKPETRAVAEDLLKRMREHKTAASLVEFADDTAEEWAALPDKWLGHYQAEYQMLLGFTPQTEGGLTWLNTDEEPWFDLAQQEKGNRQAPGFHRQLNVDGKDYWVSAWKRKAGRSPNAPSLSFQVKPKDGKPMATQSGQGRSQSGNDKDSEIPF